MEFLPGGRPPTRHGGSSPAKVFAECRAKKQPPGDGAGAPFRASQPARTAAARRAWGKKSNNTKAMPNLLGSGVIWPNRATERIAVALASIEIWSFEPFGCKGRGATGKVLGLFSHGAGASRC